MRLVGLVARDTPTASLLRDDTTHPAGRPSLSPQGVSDTLARWAMTE